ncbi:MAG: helix-turn-helix domain-containing protein [Deltaproteobacteria bacterium]|nr:helix-turn-helix domain-containing protein [Deltaproteobacteria bacterium]
MAYEPREEDLEKLERWASGVAPEKVLETRSKIVLMTLDQVPPSDIAFELDVELSEVDSWWERFRRLGPDGLRDRQWFLPPKLPSEMAGPRRKRSNSSTAGVRLVPGSAEPEGGGESRAVPEPVLSAVQMPEFNRVYGRTSSGSLSSEPLDFSFPASPGNLSSDPPEISGPASSGSLSSDPPEISGPASPGSLSSDPPEISGPAPPGSRRQARTESHGREPDVSCPPSPAEGPGPKPSGRRRQALPVSPAPAGEEILPAVPPENQCDGPGTPAREEQGIRWDDALNVDLLRRTSVPDDKEFRWPGLPRLRAGAVPAGKKALWPMFSDVQGGALPGSPVPALHETLLPASPGVTGPGPSAGPGRKKGGRAGLPRAGRPGAKGRPAADPSGTLRDGFPETPDPDDGPPAKTAPWYLRVRESVLSLLDTPPPPGGDGRWTFGLVAEKLGKPPALVKEIMDDGGLGESCGPDPVPEVEPAPSRGGKRASGTVPTRGRKKGDGVPSARGGKKSDGVPCARAGKKSDGGSSARDGKKRDGVPSPRGRKNDAGGTSMCSGSVDAGMARGCSGDAPPPGGTGDAGTGSRDAVSPPVRGLARDSGAGPAWADCEYETVLDALTLLMSQGPPGGRRFWTAELLADELALPLPKLETMLGRENLVPFACTRLEPVPGFEAALDSCRGTMELWASGGTPSRLTAARAAAILAVWEGRDIDGTAAALGTSAKAVRGWCRRFAAKGLGAVGYGSRGNGVGPGREAASGPEAAEGPEGFLTLAAAGTAVTAEALTELSRVPADARDALPDQSRVPSGTGEAPQELRPAHGDLPRALPDRSSMSPDAPKSLLEWRSMPVGAASPALSAAGAVTPAPRARRSGNGTGGAPAPVPDSWLELLDAWGGAWNGRKPSGHEGPPAAADVQLLAWRAEMVRRHVSGSPLDEVGRACGASPRTVRSWSDLFRRKGPGSLLPAAAGYSPDSRGEDVLGRLSVLLAVPAPPGTGQWEPAGAAGVLGVPEEEFRKILAERGERRGLGWFAVLAGAGPQAVAGGPQAPACTDGPVLAAPAGWEEHGNAGPVPRDERPGRKLRAARVGAGRVSVRCGARSSARGGGTSGP